MATEYLHEVHPWVCLLKLVILYGANASGKSNVKAALKSEGTIRFMGMGVMLKGLLAGGAIIMVD